MQATPAAQAQPFEIGRFILVILLACAILGAREVHKLVTPQFIAEDGSIFFAQAFNVDLWSTFFTRYAGYYHLVPRLIAAAGMLLPYAWIPLFYSLVSLLISALALTWFYLPRHRQLVQNDTVRLATVLLFLCAPNLAGLMQIAYIQWPLAVWALLVALTPLPKNNGQAWAIVLVYLLVIGTAPVVIVWLPLWLWRLYHTLPQISSPSVRSGAAGRSYGLDKRRSFLPPFTVPPHIRGRVGGGVPHLQLLCLILAHGLIVFSGLTAPRTLPPASQNPWLLLLDFGRGFIYQAGVINLLGRGGSEWLLAHGGWWAMYSLGLSIGVALLVLVFQQSDHRRRFLSIFLLYVIVATSLLYLNRAALLGYSFANNLDSMHRGAARYFWIASVSFYLLVAILVDDWLATTVSTPIALVSGAGYLLLLGVYSQSFFIPAWGNIAWPPHARLLEDLQGQVGAIDHCQSLPQRTSLSAITAARSLSQSGYTLFLPLVAKAQLPPPGDFPVNLPIAPPGWVMELIVRSTPVQHMTENLMLVATEEQLFDQALHVRLFWQKKNGGALAQHPYKITLYLLDPQGKSLASDEARFEEPKNGPVDVPQLFSTQHTLALPPEHPLDAVNLAVAFYPPRDQQLQQNEQLLVHNCIRHHLTGTP